ncbi:MAG: transporter [Gemmatimonadaceae bacterium]
MTRGTCLTLLFALMALTGETALLAQAPPDTTSRNPHAVQPERPTVATHAGTVARGWIELEEGGEWDKLPSGHRLFVAPTSLKIGVAKRAQLGLLFNLIVDPALSGGSFATSDFTIGLKYRLLDDNPLLGAFALLPAVKFPTASLRGGTGTTDFSLLLISSRQVGQVAVDLNLGATRRTGDGTVVPRTAGVWTASFGFPLSGPLGATVEFFGFRRTTGPAGSNATAALLVGPTFLLREWLALDAGGIIPLAGPQPRALYAGFVWNFGCALPRRLCG